jgi:exodeoxyribonuclease (lambda-induced)
MKIHKIDQRSDEWFEIRKGKMTASNAQAISANGKGLETYIFGIMAEKLSDNKVSFSNADTERGCELEDSARMRYELENDSVTLVGFIEHDEFTGCSPDGLIGKEGGIEIKCPNDVNFLKILIYGEKAIESKYLWQCHMSMFISKRKWWDLVFYNPNFEQSMKVFRIMASDQKNAILKGGIDKGKALMIDLQKQIDALQKKGGKK